MNEGVKILLERMKTNPDEFINGTKWAGLIHGYTEYLSAEDNKILSESYNELMQQHFTERVMTELLAPEEDTSLGKPWYTKQNAMPLGGTTLGAYSNTSHATIQLQRAQAAQNTQLHELLHHKGLVEVNRKPTIRVRKPQHETLFGKLKNYLHSDT